MYAWINQLPLAAALLAAATMNALHNFLKLPLPFLSSFGTRPRAVRVIVKLFT